MVRKFGTASGRLLVAFGLLAGMLVGPDSIANAQGCNVVNVETVIPPDNFGQTVYVSLLSTQGAVETTCMASFPYPPSGETDTVQEKCAQLENAVATQCSGAQFGTVDDCMANAKFQVFDVNFLATLSLGISNDPNMFSQTGDGQAIPDYEGDRIVNSCGGPGYGSNGAFGGEATGVKIREENASSGVIVFLDVFLTDTVNLPPDPPVLDRELTSIVASSPGDSALTLVSAVAADLQDQIANDPAIAGLITVGQNGRTLEIRTSETGLAVAGVFMSNDTGITSSSIGGTVEGLATLTAPHATTPALGGFGIALCSLLLGGGAWMVLRRRPA